MFFLNINLFYTLKNREDANMGNFKKIYILQKQDIAMRW